MKTKAIILLILIVLFAIFVSQNTEVIKISAFFWTFQMSTIVLISLTGLAGIIIGFIIASLASSSQKKKQKMKEEQKKQKEAAKTKEALFENNKGDLDKRKPS